MKINSSNNTQFQSGLTTKLLIKERFNNASKTEKMFVENFGVETRFSGNNSIALANELCLDIFDKLYNKLKIDLYLPPTIFSYKNSEIIDANSASNFCISDTKEVLKNEYPFPGRSIFFKEFPNLSFIDDITEFEYQNKKSSSNHFLAPFIHEWLHSLQLHHIYSQYGYGGNCEYLNSLYPKTDKNISGVELVKKLETKVLSKKENEVIFDNLGEYATKPINQYLEVFSETFTKFICKSLKGAELFKNPLDEIKNSNLDFQNIIQKVCHFE